MLYDELIKIADDLRALAFFCEKSNLKESLDLKDSLELKISDLRTKSAILSNKIKQNENKLKFIEGLPVEKESSTDDDYLAGSKISAVNKGHEVLRKLEIYNYDINNYGFVSLGGGDGTELFIEIENSSIDYGLLLEYDHNSVNKFEQNKIPFLFRNYNRPEIRLDAIECDLLDENKLNTAKELINSGDLKGIIISIHAVLHELSTRSQLKSRFLDTNGEISLEDFFRELYEWHKNIIIFIREPGIVENWPKDVYITISNRYLEDFLKILDEIDGSHFRGKENPNYRHLEEQEKIRCKSDLAIEALTKLFYKKDYDYERREQITSVSREKIVRALQAGEKLFEVHESETFYTESVEKNMNKYGVRVTERENIPLSNPQCFTYTIALKGTHKKIR